jgi:hypothetical protein
MSGYWTPCARTALLLAASILCAQCSESPTGSSVKYDGTWTGTTSQSLPITFTVAGNAVTTISVNIRASMAGSSCTYSTGSQEKPAIVNGAFALNIGGGTVSTRLTGTFTSDTAASGNIEAFSVSGLACGSTFVIGTPSSQSARTWTATRQ